MQVGGAAVIRGVPKSKTKRDWALVGGTGSVRILGRIQENRTGFEEYIKGVNPNLPHF